MSWSARFDYVDGNVVDETVVESNIDPDYHNDQYEEALDAVWKIIRSGTLGDPKTDAYKVSITGHGNKNHEKAVGWGNDFISIQVTQQ